MIEDSVEKERLRINERDNYDTIKLKDVHKVYDNNFYAVKGINFGVKEGEIFGLLGPNGAGKSTTFNLLTSKL